MDLGFTGKAALVTGASRGIGFGTARALASEGADVILVSREIQLADVKQRMGPTRGSIEVFNADLSVSGTAEKLGKRGRNPCQQCRCRSWRNATADR